MKIPNKLKQDLLLISPKWVKKIEMRKEPAEILETCKIDRKEISLASYKTCVVGEAYLFKSNYDLPNKVRFCTRCFDFADAIYNVLAVRHSAAQHWYDDYNPDEYDYKIFIATLRKFVKHFKDKHPELLKEKKK